MIYKYMNEIDDMLDSACNDLSPEQFEHLLELVKDMIDGYED